MSEREEFIITDGVLEKYVGTGGDVVVPDGVKVIGGQAFIRCKEIQSIRLPQSVVKIGDSAFTRCDNLQHFEAVNPEIKISPLAFGYGKTETRKTIYLPEYIYLPNISLADCSTAMQKLFFTACYLTCVERHTEEAKAQYNKYAKTNKNKLLSAIIQNDNVNAMKNMASLGIGKDNISDLIDEAVRYEKEKTASFLQEYGKVHFPDIVNGKENLIKQPLLTKTEKDFIVEEGVLVRYTGDATDIIIPEGVIKISNKTFSWDVFFNMVSLTIPDSVKEIEEKTFRLGYGNLSPSWYREQAKLTSVRVSDYLAGKLTMPQIKKIFDIDALVNALLKHPNGFEGTFRDKVVKFVKEHKKEIIQEIIRYDDAEMMDNYLILIDATLSDVEYFINTAEKTDQGKMVRACLLNYQNKHFSNEKINQFEEEKLNYELDFASRTLAQWRKIFKIRMIDGGVEIAGYKSQEENVIIPSKIDSYDVIKIATEGFKNCRYIQSITIPEGITRLEYQQFAGCSALKEIVLPSTLKSIDYYAFAQCGKLESIYIPDGVNTIMMSAFDSCSGLKKVYLPSKIKSLHKFLFSDCRNVTIHAPKGSYVETYANENGIAFVAE